MLTWCQFFRMIWLTNICLRCRTWSNHDDEFRQPFQSVNMFQSFFGKSYTLMITCCLCVSKRRSCQSVWSMTLMDVYCLPDAYATERVGYLDKIILHRIILLVWLTNIMSEIRNLIKLRCWVGQLFQKQARGKGWVKKNSRIIKFKFCHALWHG